MKKTFLILLVLFCVATMAVASASAASEDMVSDDLGTIDLDDNAIEPIGSTDIEDAVTDTASDDCGTNDKSVGASPLNDGNNIYVSTTGDDSKDGSSEENAVATISKAVELAGDGDTINIANGEYTTPAIDLPASKSLSFIGAEKDGVTLKGTGNYVIGMIESGSSLTFKNLIFTGVDSTAGTSTGLRVGGNSPLEIANCTFTNINAKYGGLYVYTSNVAKVTDCTFKDISCSATGGAAGVYMTNGNVTFDKCIFDGFTYTPSSGYIYGVFYQTNGNLTIANSIVKNTDAYAYAVLRTSKLNTYLRNTTFANNIVRPNPNSYNNFGETIIQAAGASAHLTVEGCSFIENQARFGVVQVQRIYGSISNSAFLDNKLVEGEGDLLAINASSSYSPEIYANCNYFGTNDNPSSLVSGVTLDNWVIMSASASEDSVAVGDEITVTADFSKYTDGTATGDVTGTMAEVPVKFINDNTKGSISDISYENNKAIVTYTGVAEGEDTVAVTAGQSINVPITVTAGGPVASPIYVSKDGDDGNAGTEDAPVATVAKAIELATAEGGSGKVIINEGTYAESGIVIKGDVDITTVGDVILNGNGARYFDIQSGDVSIANVTMTNCNNSYGGAVIRITGGSLSIEDSFIVANGGEYRENLIRVTGASLTLKNTVFENNTAHKTSTNYGGLYVSDGVLIVDGCTFKDNFNKYGQIYVTGSSTGSVAVINNTQFIGNNATSSSGGTGAGIYLGGTAAYQYSNGTVRPGAPATVYVIGCEFINNSAKGANYYAGQGGAIYVNNNATLYVSGSKFINNTCIDNNNGTVKSNGGAIYASAGNVNIANSIFENNVASEGSEIYMKYYGKDNDTLNYLDISNSIIIDNGDSVIVSNYTNGTLLANSNWWGSNDNPADKVSEGIVIDNWVIMNVNPVSVESAVTGEPIEISIDFKHTNSTEGTIAALEGTLPQEFTVYGGIDSGTISESPVTTVDLEAKLVYTPAFAGENIVNVYTDAGNSIPVVIYATEPYTGPIYVSKDGDDANSGEEDSPVATIAKAIELANEGSGQVIINEGTYVETGFTVSKDMTITGVGDVVIDGNNQSTKVFTIGAGVSSFELNNVKVTRANSNYGAVLYDNVPGSTATLNNVTLVENVAESGWSSTSILYISGANLVIKDSTIANHTVRGLIYNNGGNLTINNSAFENNNADIDSSANMGAIYSTGAVNVAIENSNFTNTASRQGAVYVTGTDSNLTVSGSSFVNSNCEVGSGGAIHADSSLTVDNSKFINNTASRDGGAIYASKGAVISNSVFMGGISNTNEYGGYDGDEIAASGDVTLNNNIILKTEGSSNKAVKVTGSGTVDINSNWWGTNDPASLISGASPDNWVIMSVNPTLVEDAYTGVAVDIAIDFKHTNSTDGTIADLVGTLPEEITVYGSALSGTFSESPVTTSGLVAELSFTPGEAGETVANVYTDTSNSVPVTIIATTPYTGVIYVSKDGDDENEGSEDSPVATIEKAIELATGQFGNGKIIINEGTYTAKAINITDDVEITSNGDVIIDGNGTKAFFIKSGEVSISNITFTNCLDQYSGSAIRVSGGDVTIDGCTFVNNGGSNARDSIINIKNAFVTITNTKFENNTAHATSTSYSVIYASDSTLIVDNCNFTDNKMKYGSIYLSGTIGVINNTQFVGMNTVSSSGGSGGGLYLSGTSAYTYSNGTTRPGVPSIVLVENCDFINNTVNGGTYACGQGAAVYVNNNATLIVKDSRFINNTCMDNTGGTVTGKGGAIFASAGSVTVMNSIFENNAASEGSEIYMKAYGTDTNTLNFLNITNCIINDDGDSVIVSNYTNGTLIANSNWWGSNDNPEDKVTEGIVIDNWVIMSVDPVYVPLTEARDVEITIDFTHVTDAQGTLSELEGTLPQEFTVKAMTMTGTLSDNTLTTVDGVAKLTFTPEETGESVAFIVYEDIHANVTVNITGPYEGPIYVSTTGNDENPGSPDAPVATIAKAVELANAGSGKVIITEGTYTESNITLDSEKSIEITGEGNVIIDGGASTDSIFYMHGGEATFANIEFTNAKPNYGGAIRVNYARAGNSREVIDINLTVDNCTFKDLQTTSRGGAIYAWYTKGNMIIKDSEFSGFNTSGWGGAVCVGYSAYENSLNFEVINSSFHDSNANNGGALYIYAETINIVNSTFYNNNATYSPGAMYLYNCSATIDNCLIYDNHAKNTAAAIEVESVSKQPVATLTINNSIIENNTGLETPAAAINVDKATLEVSYSSLVNELSINTVTATGYDAVYGQGIAIANNNWWGTNDPTSAVNGTNITLDKWVIMNVEANATDVVAGDEVKVTVDFNHVNTTAGEIEELTGGAIPKDTYTVVFTSENGTVAPQTVEVPKGAFADVIFTASEPFATVTATSEEAVATLIFEGYIPEPYTGIVYVSKDGDDANNGSEEAPVSSIAKAIEIATAEGGSGQIIINEGTYAGCDYLITKDLTITGVGDVVIDGEGLGRLFYMESGAQVNKFEINNAVLTGAKHDYGAAVYSFAKETALNNVTIFNNPGAGDLITTNGDLSIRDSRIYGNDVGDIIQSSALKATIILNNTVFEDNNVTSDSQNFGIVYINGANSNLIVEDCKFMDNTARQGVLIGSTGTNITVKGTEFINNSNTVAYGGVIRALAKLDVSDSVFINNNAGREGGAIYIGSNGNANITKSEFINNTCGHYDSDYNGDIISSYGKLTINYCILLPTEGSTKVLIFNGNEDETPNAQYNWWGTNDNPSGLVAGNSYYDSWDGDVDCPAPDVSNWIIMNVEVDIEDVEVGAQLPISVDFKHYLDANGEIQELADSLAQELTVSFISETGTFDSNEVTTVDQAAIGTYTVAEGLNSITVKSSDATVSIGFEVSSIIETALSVNNATVSVDAGSGSLIATLTADGVGVEGKTISVVINGNALTAVTDADGKAVIDLSGLAPGTYSDLTVQFAGDEGYAASSAAVSIIVGKYSTDLAADNVTVTVGSGSLTATLTSSGAPVQGKTIKVTVGTIDTTATTDASGVATVDLSSLALGTYTASIVFEGDDEYADASAEATVTVSKVKKTAQDLQELIDNAPEGSVVDLGEYDYENVSNVNITKDITLMGNGTTISGAGDGTPIFNIVPKSENGPEEVNITNVEFKVNNADTIVKAIAENGTDATSIDVASINFSSNNVTKANDDVVSESVTVLKLESERGVLSPTGDISITGNNIDAGVKPFKFDVTSVNTETGTVITNQNITPEKKATVIHYENMNTTAVDQSVDGRVGEWFEFKLTDTEGNPIANTPMQIGFLGVIYDESDNIITDENGVAGLQINLGWKNDYTFAICFLGNDEYNASFVVAKINVAPQKGSLTVPNKSDSASAKTQTLTATFKSASGKPVAGKTIKFTVNGKTYSAKTNDKGVASVNVSLSKKGTYSFTAKFATNGMYATMTKTAKLTIK